jgi:hypothetical protein
MFKVGDRVRRARNRRKWLLKEVGVVLEIDADRAFVQWPTTGKRYSAASRLLIVSQEDCKNDRN